MIDLYYWPTPNGHKITVCLEELGMPYEIKPVNIGKGDQFKEDYLKISPNSKMPAIVDHKASGNHGSLAIFESGAILMYLAEKGKKFFPQETHEKYHVLQWLFWQVGGLGPMAGQNGHFVKYAPEKIPYAIDRYVKETERLYTVLDHALEKHAHVGGKEYSIADMAIYPWIVPHEMHGQDLNNFPSLKMWFEKIKARPAVVRAYKKADDVVKPT